MKKTIVVPFLLAVSATAVVCFAQSPLRRSTMLNTATRPVMMPNKGHYPFRTVSRVRPHDNTRRVDRTIEICPPHNCSSAISYSPNPIGAYIDVGDNPVFVLKVCVAGASRLGVLLETSCDDGQTWIEVANLTATSGGTYYVPVSALSQYQNSVNNQVVPASPGGPNNSSCQGPAGNKWRVESLSGSTGDMWQFQALVLPGSNNHLR
jgi:hypothetical protein